MCINSAPTIAIIRSHSMPCTILVYLILWSVNEATSLEKAEDNYGLPTFIKEPPSVVYYAVPKDLPSSDNQALSFELEAVIQPSNATITIATARPDDPENYLFLPILRTSTHTDRISAAVPYSQPYAILRTSSGNNQQTDQSSSTYTWTVRVYNLPPNAILHLLASTTSGTTRSRPIKLIHMELPGFPRYADESLSLLIGNTGRLVCHLPRAQPSLPTVNFYHNGARLDMSDGTRYRLIYLGGDGTGVPWEERALQSHQQKTSQSWKSLGDHTNIDPIFNNPMPSAAVLLIHPLRLTDSGEYRCQARLGSKEVFSEQRTLLNVTKPREKVLARLQFSSDDPEISYLYSHLIESSSNTPTNPVRLSHMRVQSAPVSDLNSIATVTEPNERRVSSITPTRILTVPEGINLTMFCTYEGAPIVSTRWFFDAPNSNVHQDSQFGVLIISRVTKSNEGTYTCSPHTPGLDEARKSFKIQVKQRNQLRMEPGPLITIGTGQNVTLRCGYAEQTRASHSLTTSYSADIETRDSELDFRHFQLGTDLGWYHNGKSIDIKQKYGKVVIEATTDATELHIINVSNYDQGIYQCWTLDNTGSWSTISSAVTIGSEAQQFKELQETRSEEGLIRERTREGLTGHMTCNISAILLTDAIEHSDLGTQHDDVVVVWYRGASDSEPIDLSGNQSGGIKYLRSTVDWASQILSVVNPRKSKDDGIYACKVYDRRTNSLLGEMKFELIIDSAKEAIAEERSKSNTKTVTQSKIDPKKSQMALGEIENIQDISSNVKSALEREFPVSTPHIRRVSNFTTTIHISWSLSDRTVAAQVTHFEIELRMLKSTTEARLRRIKRGVGMPVRTGTLPFSLEEDYWTLPSRIANVGLKNDFCLTDSKEIQAGRVYSVRVVGIIRPEDQMEFTSEIAVKSPWSNHINFENLVNVQPTITSILATNRTQLRLEWTLPTKSTWNLPSLPPTGTIYIHFQALLTPLVSNENSSYPQKSPWRSCQQEDEVVAQSRGQQIFLGSWHLNRDTKDLKPFQSTMGNLEPNTTYAVAIYGMLSLSKQRHREPDSFGWYTLLSAEAIEQTPSEDNDEAKTALDHAQKSILKQEIGKESKTASNRDHGDVNTGTEQESHVLVVILGSLAGVLLVISLALIGLCIWYHLRTKRLVYQEAIESPNKLGITTSSLELSSTPNGFLLNTTNPVLNFMDSTYPAQFTGSPQMQHLGISNPSLRQLAELQSLYQLSGCPPPQAWSTMPFNPGEKAQQHLLQQQQQQQQPAQSQAWMNVNMSKTSISTGVVLTGSYPYGKTAQSVESTVHHRPVHDQQEVDSLLRCDSDLSDKVVQTGDTKRPPFDAHIESLGGNCSSPGASDNEDGEGARIIPNDQSSSIYSHIGSESTLNELPPKLLDRRGCFSPQPPPPPPIATGPLGFAGPFSPLGKYTNGFHTSDNPNIQRPIPMYLSAPGVSPQFQNAAIWNQGFMPVNTGALTANNWLNHPAVQASLMARQQSISIGQYPLAMLDSSMIPPQFPTPQPPSIFYRTLPNRKITDMTPRMTTKLGLGHTSESPDRTQARRDLLLPSTETEWPGTPLGNTVHPDLCAAPLLRSANTATEPDLMSNEHPSTQFVLKYWMANSTKPDPIRETSGVITTRDTQVSSKPPSSAESGRGSRPSGAGSEHSASGERKHPELNQSFGDSGVDLHVSLHNEADIGKPSRNKTGELSHQDKKSEHSGIGKENKLGKAYRSRPKKATYQTNPITRNEQPGQNELTKPTVDQMTNRKRPYSEFSSQSSLGSDDRLGRDTVEQGPGETESDTWQLREPNDRKGLTTQPVPPSDELPSISSSI